MSTTTARYALLRAAFVSASLRLTDAQRAHDAAGPTSEREAQRLDQLADAALTLAIRAQALAYGEHCSPRLAEITVADALLDRLASELPIGKVDARVLAAAMGDGRSARSPSCPSP